MKRRSRKKRAASFSKPGDYSLRRPRRFGGAFFWVWGGFGGGFGFEGCRPGAGAGLGDSPAPGKVKSRCLTLRHVSRHPRRGPPRVIPHRPWPRSTGLLHPRLPNKRRVRSPREKAADLRPGSGSAREIDNAPAAQTRKPRGRHLPPQNIRDSAPGKRETRIPSGPPPPIPLPAPKTPRALWPPPNRILPYTSSRPVPTEQIAQFPLFSALAPHPAPDRHAPARGGPQLHRGDSERFFARLVKQKPYFDRDTL